VGSRASGGSGNKILRLKEADAATELRASSSPLLSRPGAGGAKRKAEGSAGRAAGPGRRGGCAGKKTHQKRPRMPLPPLRTPPPSQWYAAACGFCFCSVLRFAFN
jgi:hypothetical protein